MTLHAPVAHGYTMRDIDQIAVRACRQDRSLASDAGTRYDTAWSAIAEHLCTAQEAPSWHELFTTGWRAIYNEVREMRHTFGFFEKDGTNGVASAPRFVAYWTLPDSKPEDGLVERLAVGQILATLTETERAAVIALATLDDYQAAADHLGIGYSALTLRMSNARKRFRAHWYAPETAPPVKGTDRRIGSRNKPLATHCRGGKGPHEMTPENTYRRPNPKPGKRGERVCRACETERSQARHAAKRAA